MQQPDSRSNLGIECRNVRRVFGETVAVADVTLTAPVGEVTALVGPNGAGKTTLLLMLATLLRPDAGSIRLAGLDPVADTAGVRARIGWMPDAFGSYETLTAREVLEFVAAAYRIPADNGRKRAGQLLEQAHLTELADRPVHVLSRGQKQRLGLARALVHEPEVLLLDEPAAGLDPRSRIELRELLRKFAADGGTVLVSSHVLTELEEMADRVVFVDRGSTTDSTAVTELSRGQRLWRLRGLDQEALTSALSELGRTHDVATTAGVDVLLSGDEDAAQLVAALVGAGVALTTCAPVGGALESAYLERTEDRT